MYQCQSGGFARVQLQRRSSFIVQIVSCCGGLTNDFLDNKTAPLGFKRENGLNLAGCFSVFAQQGIESICQHIAEDPLPDLLDILQGKSPYNSKPVEIEYPPATRFTYSDAGYCVIEQLLTDVVGKPFGKLSRQLIIDPLGMTNSCFQHAFEFDDTTHVAVGHDRHGSVVDGTRPTYPYPAAAGLWSTVTDLSLLVIELQQSLQGAGKLRISPHLVQDMLTSQGCAAWAGLGVFLRGEGMQTRMSSLGWGVGFQCMLATYPYLGGGAVVMTNSDPGYPQEKALTGELISSVEREYALPGIRH